MGQHVNAMTAGTFDAGYTLEPNASTMRKMGVATTSRPASSPITCWAIPMPMRFVGGCALTSDFIKSRPDVAKRFTAAWAQGGRRSSTTTRPRRASTSLKNTFTPDDVVDTVPMIRYFMVKDLTAKDKADFQKFIDFSVQDRNAAGKGRRDRNICRRSDQLRAGRHALMPAAEIGRPRGGTPRRPRPPAHVTVRGLSKQFGNASIYDDFDLDIPRGKLVSVFGPNGCGKSTLINMIAGLIPLDAGEILFDGKPLSADQVRLRVPELPRGAVSVAALVRQHRVSAQADEGAQGASGARGSSGWSPISA